ncbi:MAG: hypothetical protein PVF63_10210 [Gammaproteobacteria bacterium]|jgi:hypothetical protein
MSIRKAFRLPANMLATTSLFMLVACGGGGGGGGGDAPAAGSQPAAPPTQQMSFTVSLEGIDVRRASNGESIAADTSGVTQNLTFEE